MVGPEEEGGEAGDGFLGMVFDAGPLGVGGGLASSVTLALQVSICTLVTRTRLRFCGFLTRMLL